MNISEEMLVVIVFVLVVLFAVAVVGGVDN